MPLVGPVIRSFGASASDFRAPRVGDASVPVSQHGVGPSATGGVSFTTYLREAMDEINSLQNEADAATTAMAAGDLADIHQAVIASEKASLAMQLAIEVRNKVLEAYQEIMRMQI